MYVYGHVVLCVNSYEQKKQKQKICGENTCCGPNKFDPSIDSSFEFRNRILADTHYMECDSLKEILSVSISVTV